MIRREALRARIKSALKRSRVTALLGPRQCGKTTLARELVSSDSANYFDLEDPAALARLEQPMTALQELKGIVVIDEIQRRPDLFPVLRVLADRSPLKAKFFILGSASGELLRQSSESLAGRLERVEIAGFQLSEVGWAGYGRHWLRGGFPLSFLSRTEADSGAWRKNFIQTFLERDIPQMGVKTPATTLHRFWTMIAHYHGQIWNSAEPARSLDIGESSVRRYLDMLTDVFMIRQLRPWHANLKKRQVKAPKIYVRDSGLLHTLLGIKAQQDLSAHPKCGSSWEGYAIEEAIRVIRPDETYFWATHGGAELDLLLIKNGKKFGVECKRTDAPRLTASMQIAMRDLDLRRLLVVYPGDKKYSLTSKILALPFRDLALGAEDVA